uniref:Uncharacterized protein n=1 Tax=Rhizophora mucronata TaxID=61149 RepID=A0A2P2P7U7_RHIMU
MNEWQLVFDKPLTKNFWLSSSPLIEVSIKFCSTI